MIERLCSYIKASAILTLSFLSLDYKISNLSLSIAMTNRAVLLLLSLSAFIAVSVSVPVIRYQGNPDDRNPDQQAHSAPEAVQNVVRQLETMGGKVCYIKYE